MLRRELGRTPGADVFCFWCGFFTVKDGLCDRCGSPAMDHPLAEIQEVMLAEAYQASMRANAAMA